MTDNTQAELDEVAQLLGIYLEEIDVDGYMPITVNRQTLAHILADRKKQTLELLDRLEAEMNRFTAEHDIPMRDEALSAIEAERNKLKESSDDKDS